jgi:hypothetical protein
VTGFVAGDQFGVGVFAPATVGVFLGVPRFLALVAVDRVVAVDELAEVFQTKRLSLQRVVNVGAVRWVSCSR